MRRKVSGLVVLLILTVSAVQPISAKGYTTSGDLFYLHQKSILYRNENASIIVIEEADFEPPNGTFPKIIEVAANIRNATTPFGTIWVGSVSWTSQPLLESTILHGTVALSVWLSSDDSTPAFSGIGAGIAIVDNQNRIIGQPAYRYAYGQGSILTKQEKRYGFDIDLTRTLEAGQRIIFAVGLGATLQGWRMKVYFDALQFPSHAQMPRNIVLVSEFGSNLTAGLALLAAIIQLTGFRRKHARNDPERVMIED